VNEVIPGDSGGEALDNSRESDAGAGWGCRPGAFVDLMPTGPPPRKVNWFSPKILWEARNDFLAKQIDDPTNDARRAWVAGLERDQLTLDLKRDQFSFLLVGDTGEGDRSQYALVPALEAQAETTDFLFICSDVIYPAGSVNDYRLKFYEPYREYPGPIYAIPGNHDWYDNLEGFMRTFCGREPPEPGNGFPRWFARAALRHRLWRHPDPCDTDAFDQARQLRGTPGQEPLPPQRSPYFALESERVVFVGIDTGITKSLDREQGEWLLEVSRSSPKAKVLLTGTPIYVNNTRQPLQIENASGSFSTVDSIVRERSHNYVAAIGGDIHNYQRYPVSVDGRTIQYIVSGGGGAFMHATHPIPKVDVAGLVEDDFKCYPLRRDSLAAYSRLFDQKLGWLRFGRRVLELTPDEAALFLQAKRGFTLTRPLSGAVPHRRRASWAAAAVLLLPAERGFHKFLSPFFDWDDPPFFKNFLRLDVTEQGLRVTCYGVTGCRNRGPRPQCEDQTPIIPLRPVSG
jgi:hypothetical protein